MSLAADTHPRGLARAVPPSSLEMAFFVFLLGGLGIILPLVLVVRQEKRALGSASLVAWLIVAYAAARLSFLIVTGEKRLLSLTFWTFVYVWMGIAPLLQTVTNEFPLRGIYGERDILVTLALVCCGVAAFEIGTWRGSLNRSPLDNMVRRVLLERDFLRWRLFIVGSASLFVATALMAVLGGATSLWVARNELAARVLEMVGREGQVNFLIFLTLLRVPTFIVFLILFALWLARRKALTQRQRLLWPVALGVFGVLTLVINNPVSSPRYWFGTIVLSLVFVALPWRSRLVLSTIGLTLLLTLLFVFPYTDVFRSGVNLSHYEGMEWTPLTDKGDYDAFQQLMNAVLYVDENGHTWGRQAVGALLFWVPRAFWPDKPNHSGELVGQDAGYNYTNLSMPLWGEAYLDAGLLGLVLIFFSYGLLLRKCEEVYVRSASELGPLGMVLIPLLAAYQLFLLRGTLMSATAYLAPIVAILWICSRREAQASPSMDVTPVSTHREGPRSHGIPSSSQ